MRIAYLDCFSGISGDMLLGAMVDAGVPLEMLQKTAEGLNVGARLEAKKVLRRAIDQFDCLYEEGADNPRVMALAVHPYLSGAPHRIKYVRQAFEYCLAKPGVHVADGEHILDWFLAESGLRAGR